MNGIPSNPDDFDASAFSSHFSDDSQANQRRRSYFGTRRLVQYTPFNSDESDSEGGNVGPSNRYLVSESSLPLI